MSPDKKRLSLLKLITQSTRLSRRKSFQAIVSGQVKINGSTVTDTGFLIDTDKEMVTINGKLVFRTPPNPLYILLHKPKGVISSVYDPEGRTTVIDLVRKIKTPLFPVGRLDIMTQGLLLLTNDGYLANALLHPSYSVPRVYHVKVKGRVPQGVFTILNKGTIKLDGRRIRPVETEVLRSLKKNTWLKVTTREGRTHEVMRMFAKLHVPVLNLIRVGFGPLTYKGLQPGQWRILMEGELRQLKRMMETAKGGKRING